MTSTIKELPVTKALSSMLSTATTFEITYIDAPDPLPVDKPYGIVDPIPGSHPSDESYDGTYHTKVLTYQISAFGASYDQAKALLDIVETVMLDNKTYPLSTVDGHTIRREQDLGSSSPSFSPARDECMVASRYTLFMAAN